MHIKNLAYRPDIDGLRALAVLSVVVFHFDKKIIPGGFSGVDIFFVISGFLITGIIYKNIINDEFYFGEFFIRRIRRIFPATFFLLLVSTFFASFWLLPEHYEVFSKSAIAATFSAANIYFWKFLDTSYFAASSDTVPLLHLWSLGVEEQFYLVWPALILISYKFGGKRLLIGAAFLLAGVSFFISQHFLKSDHSFAYYMLPSRGGELLIGALTFFLTNSINRNIPWIARELIGAAGVAAIVWSMLYLNEKDGFPGYIALVPSLGAALLIFSGCYGPSLIRTVFSIRPLVWIGIVSFSMYLWHWPVLAFYRYAYGDPNVQGIIACAAIILVMTVTSYLLVEKPFRTASGGGYKLPMIGLSGVAIVSVCAFAILNNGIIQNIYPYEYSEKIKEYQGQTSASITFDYVCQGSGGEIEVLMKDSRCIIGPNVKEPKILILGDSNSSHFVGYFKVIADKYGIAMRNISHPICPPFGVEEIAPYTPKTNQESCQNFNKVFRENLQKYDTLIISSFWTYYSEQSKTLLSDIENLVNEFPEKQIIIGLTVPMFARFDTQCYMKSVKIPEMNCESRDKVPYAEEYAINKDIRKLSRKYKNVSTFSFFDEICKENYCSSYLDGKPIYWDGYHLSGQGSELLGKRAVDQDKFPDSVRALLTKRAESVAPSRMVGTL